MANENYKEASHQEILCDADLRVTEVGSNICNSVEIGALFEHLKCEVIFGKKKHFKTLNKRRWRN